MNTLEKLIYLKEHGTSLTYIAKKAKCSPQALTMWIKGKSNISLRLEEDIIEAIKILVQEMEALK